MIWEFVAVLKLKLIWKIDGDWTDRAAGLYPHETKLIVRRKKKNKVTGNMVFFCAKIARLFAHTLSWICLSHKGVVFNNDKENFSTATNQRETETSPENLINARGYYLHLTGRILTFYFCNQTCVYKAISFSWHVDILITEIYCPLVRVLSIIYYSRSFLFEFCK